MKKTILFLFLFSIGLFGSLEAIASGGLTNIHTTPNLELKPITSLDKSYQTAAVCFLGVGDCDPNIGHSTDDDNMDVDSAKQCQNAGFIRKTCNAVQDPIKDCEHDKNFVTGCECKANLVTCTSPKFGVGLACGGKYASCQCPATVSLSQPNDRCTKTCDGNCITKTCTKTANESGCSYGTQSCSDGCGGTRQCCKAAPPCNSNHSRWCHSCQTCHGDCCTDGTYQSCDTRCGGSGCSSSGGSSGGGSTTYCSGPANGLVVYPCQNFGCSTGGKTGWKYDGQYYTEGPNCTTSFQSRFQYSGCDATLSACMSRRGYSHNNDAYPSM